MPEVTVNGINLYYETYGSGQPLVCIHGFASDHLVFTEFPEIYQNDYQLVLIDNRGSGQSDCPDSPYSVEIMAEDIVALCNILNLGPCHFIGHSMGGMILQQIAYQYPQQVRSATFCNTDMEIDIRFGLSAKSRIEFLAKKVSPTALIENVLGWVFSSEYLSRPGMVEKLIKMRLANPFPMTEIGYKNQLQALLNFDSSAWVNKIKVPSLVISSDQDIVTPSSGGKKLSELIDDAEFHCITGTGHIPFLEKPREFHPILKKFLKSLSS